MTKETKLEAALSLGSGVLFAIGLAIAGMTQPSKVIAFLDVGGAWDPSLAFVMLGAIGVSIVTNHLVTRRDAPIVGTRFHLPTRRDFDPRLVVGSAIFGVGWGLGGYCPGPGLASIGTGTLDALVFVATMGLGMVAFELVEIRRARRHGRRE